MQFSPGLEQPWIALLVFIVLSLWALRAYARTTPPLPRSRRLLLSGLRVAASLLLALMIGGFGLTLTRVEEEAPRLRVLVDASASMSRSDMSAGDGSGTTTDRYTAARGLADRVREAWGDRALVEIRAFDLDLATGPLPGAAQGTGTDLGAVLGALPAPRPGESVLLLSDGRDTEGGLWSSRLGPGRPVHTVLFGDTLPPADLRIDRVDAQPVLHKGARLPLSVEISSRGAAPRSGRLVLSEDGETLAESDWSLEPGADRMELELPLVLEETGQHLLELRVLGDESGVDAAPENDRRLIPLRVVEGRLRVLVLAGLPDWDLAALMRGLRGEEALEPVLVTAGPSGGLRRSQGGLPWRPEDEEYHGLVLHSLHRDWPGDLLDRLRIRGGTFLMGSYVARARLSELARRWSLTAPSQSPRLEETLLDWGSGASRHPGVQGLRASGPSPREQPPLESTRPNPLRDGRVLLEDESRPVLTAREMGGRRLVVSSGRGFWRWSLRSPEGGHLLENLYSGLLRWLAREDPPHRLAVSWADGGLLAGMPGELEAELFDPDFEPLAGAELSWSLRGADTLLVRGAFDEDAGTRRYAGRLPALPEGIYELEVSARTAGGEELSRELELPVLPPERELLSPAASAESLRWLAALTGGVFQPAPDLAALADRLDFTPQRRTLTRALRLWQHPAAFILLLAFLAAEWGLRKRFGMV